MADRMAGATGPVDLQPVLQRLFAVSSAPFLVVAPDPPRFTIIEVNDAYLRATMRGREGLLGVGLFDAFPDNPDDPEATGTVNLRASLERAVANRLPDRMAVQRYDIARPEGGFEERWWDPVNTPLFDPAGRVAAIIHHVEDVTAKRRSERLLRESEAYLRFVTGLDEALRQVRDAPAAMAAATALLGRHLLVSRCAYADVDADADGFVIRSDYVAPGVASSAGTYSLDLFGTRAAADMRAGRTLVVRSAAAELGPDDGGDTFAAIGIEAIVCCPLLKDGRLTAMMAVHQTVSRDWRPDEVALIRSVVERCWAHVERVGAEARLRESEERLRLATENAEVGFWDVDEINHVLHWPPLVKRMFGISAEMPVSMRDFYTGLHPDDREQTAAAYAAAADPARRALYDVEYRTVGKEDGRIRWIAAKGRGVFDPAGRCLRVTGTAMEITRRKRAEEALYELNQVLERRVEERTAERDRAWKNSRDLQLVIGDDGVFRAANDAWLSVLGHRPEAVAGCSTLDFLHPDDVEASRTALAVASTGTLPAFENRYRHRDGGWRWISWVAAPVGGLIYASGRDVTAERQHKAELEVAQEALRQAQKMEAMGQLTGGVAHDFNNLLTPIVGSLDMLQRRGLGGEREQRLISRALQSADRAKLLVQRLLAFARRQPLQSVPVDVAALVRNMGDLVASTTGPQIKVVIEAAADLPAARADPNQLEMALLNLSVNARDAMPDSGVLRIGAVAETIGPGHRAKLPPGRYVRLSVADTGTGMDAAILARATEPFFSTKGVGKGTGLGLSMVHGLASQLGGALTIQSAPGLGTNVELWLTLAASAPEPAEPAEPVPPPAAAGPALRGVALLVDDEELVRASTADMLGDLGYRVVEAASGEDAMRRLHRGEACDVVVADHLMQGVTGTELAHAVRALRPGLPVLVVSGYAEIDGIDAELPRLSKPFRKDELAASLAQITGRARFAGTA